MSLRSIRATKPQRRFQSKKPLFLMQRSIAISRIVFDSWPGGLRANDAALHLAAIWASVSAGAGGSCTACTVMAALGRRAQSSRRTAILMGGPESVIVTAG